MEALGNLAAQERTALLQEQLKVRRELCGV
jgi:hypothetical protein